MTPGTGEKNMKKLMLQGAIAAIIGTAALTAMATTASAEIVCNRSGDCWHTRDHYSYKPSFGVVVHDNNWRWRDRDHYRWREHDGRGYWRNGIWLSF
jgi:hypothetical protein